MDTPSIDSQPVELQEDNFSEAYKKKQISPHVIWGGLFLVAIVALVLVSSFRSRAALTPIAIIQTDWSGGVYTSPTSAVAGWNNYESAVGVDDASVPGEIKLDTEELDPQVFIPSAFLTSTVFDAGVVTAWSSLDWVADIPANTSIMLQIKAETGSEYSRDWSGWYTITSGDGSSGQFSISPPIMSRYIRYRVGLNTEDTVVSPILQELTFVGMRDSNYVPPYTSPYSSPYTSTATLPYTPPYTYTGPYTTPSTSPYVITYTSPIAGRITIPSENISADDSTTIDLSAGITVTTGTFTVGGSEITIEKEVQIDTSGGDLVITNSDLTGTLEDASVNISDGTKIASTDSWDGTIAPPTQGTVENPPSRSRFGATVISVGSSDSVLIFDQPVLISVNNLTNRGIPSLRYKSPGSNKWNRVAKCSGTFASPVMPTYPGECYVFDGVDTLNIWTYHFTVFAEILSPPPSYSATPREAPGSIMPEVPSVVSPTPGQDEAPITPEIPVQPNPTIPVVPTEPEIMPIPVSEFAENTLKEVLASPIPLFPDNWVPGPRREPWAQEHRRAIYQAYVDNLGRRPSAEEVNWQFQNNKDIFSIRQSLLVSEEFIEKWGAPWRVW